MKCVLSSHRHYSAHDRPTCHGSMTTRLYPASPTPGRESAEFQGIHIPGFSPIWAWYRWRGTRYSKGLT